MDLVIGFRVAFFDHEMLITDSWDMAEHYLKWVPKQVLLHFMRIGKSMGVLACCEVNKCRCIFLQGMVLG